MLMNFDPTAVDDTLFDELLEAMAGADWKRVGDRNYPPHYFFSLGRYPVHPEDVERMRTALAGIPRVDPADYDILFNAVLRTWDIVKWVPLPEPVGVVGEHGYTSRVVLEPIDVYSIPAGARDPSTLSELDWEWMRRWCTTARSIAALGDRANEDLALSQAQRAAALEGEREAAEHDLAGWMRDLCRRVRDETGYGDLPPEEMARRTGTPVRQWMDDTPKE